MHQFFRLRVEGRCGFIQQQNRRIFQHRAGDGHALTLAARQGRAARANSRFQPCGQGFGKFHHGGVFCGFGHIGAVSIKPPHADIIFDAFIEQRRVLAHNRDHVAQGGQISLGGRNTADAHPACHWINQACQQGKQRGLARA